MSLLGRVGGLNPRFPGLAQKMLNLREKRAGKKFSCIIFYYKVNITLHPVLARTRCARPGRVRFSAEISKFMRPRTKICGLTRPEDVRLARELGADYFGVVLYAGSPRYVPAESLASLLAAMPPGRRVAVSVSPAPGQLKQLGETGFDFFQVHYDPFAMGEAALQVWKEEVGAERLWLAPRLPPGQEFPSSALAVAQTLLLDTYQQGTYGGSGRTGDWSHFRALSETHPQHRWVLSGGLRPENIRAALRSSGAKTVDVNSGVETAPGIKDAVLLDLLFANLVAG